MKYHAGMQFITRVAQSLLVLAVAVQCGVIQAEESKSCSAEFKACRVESLNQLNILYQSCVRKVPEIISADKEAALCDAKYASCESDVADEEYLTRLKSGSDQNWETATAKSLGFNTTLFDHAFKSAGEIPRFKSLTVLHKGKLVKQRFYNQSRKELPQPVDGITQSITSLLVGIAIEKGFIKSVNQDLKSFFPDRFSSEKDKTKGDITIKQLLTMKSGIAFSDGQNWRSWTDYFDWLRADNARDWILEKPGPAQNASAERRFNYSTPSIDLLGAIIRESSGMTLKQFADKYLFQPLGIKYYLWDHDSHGNYYAGTGLRMYPDDLARIGQLVLDNGAFKGQQIVPRQWLKKSVHETFEVRQGWDSGYLWLAIKINKLKVPHAEGAGGQFILIVPELDTVIVTTSNTILCSGPERRMRAQKALAVAKQVIQSITDTRGRKI